MPNIKQFFKYFLYYLAAFLLILYVITINEGMEVFGILSYMEGIPKSFGYYLFWVLPYWSLALSLVAAVFAIITFVIVKLIKKI